jgi:hypothetical protein
MEFVTNVTFHVTFVHQTKQVKTYRTIVKLYFILPKTQLEQKLYSHMFYICRRILFLRRSNQSYLSRSSSDRYQCCWPTHIRATCWTHPNSLELTTSTISRDQYKSLVVQYPSLLRQTNELKRLTIWSTNGRMREKGGRRESSERHYFHGRYISAMNVPRHSPFVLLIKARWRQGKASWTRDEKWSRVLLCSTGILNVGINLVKAAFL